MKQMWQETAVPFLRSQGWGKEVIYSRVLRFWGIPESVLAEKVAAQIAREHPTVAPYASNGETRLRITVRAKDEAEAQQLIQPVEAEIRQIVGLDCYGADEDTLASAVARLLQERQQTVAVAESCTAVALGRC